MTDYERVTTRESTTIDPLTPVDPATGAALPPAAAPAPAAADSVRTTERAYTPAGPGAASTFARIVTLLFGLLQVALILRIILVLLVANQGNDIVSLIMNITDPFVEPFRGMFSIDRATVGQGRLDVAAVVALIAWTMIEALVLALLRIFDRRTPDAA